MQFTVANWHNMGCVITQTRSQAFQTTLCRAFEALREVQKLGLEFEMLSRVFKNLGRVCVLQHGPC